MRCLSEGGELLMESFGLYYSVYFNSTYNFSEDCVFLGNVVFPNRKFTVTQSDDLLILRDHRLCPKTYEVITTKFELLVSDYRL
jgi:hypothetical protein